MVISSKSKTKITLKKQKSILIKNKIKFNKAAADAQAGKSSKKLRFNVSEQTSMKKKKKMKQEKTAASKAVLPTTSKETTLDWALGEDDSSDSGSPKSKIPKNYEPDLSESQSDVSDLLDQGELEELLNKANSRDEESAFSSCDDDDEDSGSEVEDQQATEEIADSGEPAQNLEQEVISRALELANRSVYFLHIPKNGCTMNVLKQLSPPLVSCRFSYNMKDKCLKTFAFLVYQDAKTASDERARLSGKQFGGKACQTKPATLPVTGGELKLQQLLVCNLAASVRLSDLKALFPNASDIQLPRSANSLPDQQNLGFANLHFLSEKLAREAFHTMHKRELHGLPLHVNFVTASNSRIASDSNKVQASKTVPLLLQPESQKTATKKEQENVVAPMGKDQVFVTSNKKQILVQTIRDDDEPRVPAVVCFALEKEKNLVTSVPKSTNRIASVLAGLQTASQDQDSQEEESDDEEDGDDTENESDDEDEEEITDEDEDEEEAESSDQEEVEAKKIDENEKADEEKSSQEDQADSDHADEEIDAEDARMESVLKSMKDSRRAIKTGNMKRCWNIGNINKGKPKIDSRQAKKRR